MSHLRGSTDRVRVVTAEETERVRARDPDLFLDACRLVHELNPLGLSHALYPDDFEPEVTTILLRLGGARRKSEALRVVHEEFVAWFGEDLAGAESSYARLADALWDRWQASANRP